MSLQKISLSNLWKYPFGTEVTIQAEDFEGSQLSQDSRTLIFNDHDSEHGSQLMTSDGVEFWPNSDLEVFIEVPELPQLVENYIQSMTFSHLALLEEPKMHADILDEKEIIIERTVNLQRLLKGE